MRTQPALSLDAILSAIACLCSTSDVHRSHVSTLFNATDFTMTNTGYWNPTEQLNDIQERLTKLELKIERIYELVQEQFEDSDLAPSNCFTLRLPPEGEQVIDYMISDSLQYRGVCKNIPSYGNWLLIQRRRNGEENFYRNWQDYRDGFGSFDGDFFIGLERLYQFTKGVSYQLLIRMKKSNDDFYYLAHYNRFEISDERSGYALRTLGKYEGTAGNAFPYHVDAKFSTYDRDNDKDPLRNCAKILNGAWWFTDCFTSSFKTHLNGKYFPTGVPTAMRAGIIWDNLTGYNSSLTHVEMLISLRI